MQAEVLADEIHAIADTPLIGEKRTIKANGDEEVVMGDMIEHRRLQIDARKWTAAKLLPRKYGDSQRVELSGSINLTTTPDEDLISELVELALSGRLGLPEGTEVVTQPEEGEEAWSEFS